MRISVASEASGQFIASSNDVSNDDVCTLEMLGNVQTGFSHFRRQSGEISYSANQKRLSVSWLRRRLCAMHLNFSVLRMQFVQ